VRIIAGQARGVRLDSAEVPALRPMLDRVKESLFNILRDCVAGARVLDLFSGSGSLGLEALSRGAEHCTFVEEDPLLVALAARNAGRCRLSERCEFLQADVMALPGVERLPAGLPADLVFVDAPYALVDDPNRRAELFAVLDALVGRWMGADAVAVLHHRPIPYAVWPTRRLRQWDRRIYGESQLTFFELEAEDGA
jgi:16S rRNA (guanine966-N2)-methyltransferase